VVNCVFHYLVLLPLHFYQHKKRLQLTREGLNEALHLLLLLELLRLRHLLIPKVFNAALQLFELDIKTKLLYVIANCVRSTKNTLLLIDKILFQDARETLKLLELALNVLNKFESAVNPISV